MSSPLQSSEDRIEACKVVESIAGSILDWLHAQCAADREYASGGVYETEWSAGIAELLHQQGFPSEHQKRYPGSRKSCDIVTTLPRSKELWLEVKGAWLTTQHETDSCGRVTFRKNGVFRKHLFSPQESALRDITEKLPTIISENAIGAVLLIGFDSYGCPMDDAIAELANRTGVNQPPWNEVYREWQNQFEGKYRVRCWFWYK